MTTKPPVLASAVEAVAILIAIRHVIAYAEIKPSQPKEG